MPSSRSIKPKLDRNLQLSRRRTLGAMSASALCTGLSPRLTRAAGPELAPSEVPTKLALDWYRLALELTRQTPGYAPPVAARSFGYLGCALYQALQTGMPGYRSLHDLLPDFPATRVPKAPMHYGLVANAALAELSSLLYPTTVTSLWDRIAALRSSYQEQFRTEAGGNFDASVKQGEIVGRQVYVHATKDGGHAAYRNNFPSSFKPLVGEGLWEPTGPTFQALLPYWPEVRPFVLPNADIFDPGPHIPPFSTDRSSPFYALADEVRNAVINAQDEERYIARYWSDDPGGTYTPAGHSISIATQVIEEQKLSMDAAVQVYLKLGIALADAFISCWACKYRYNVIRPITYIQRHIPGNENWSPILSTPPFPEYSSGHSVQSGAMSKVMTSLFGRGYAFVDRTQTNFGFEPREFDSFFDAAREAALSRLYGGVHYTPAIELGVTQGEKVGELVLSTLQLT